MAISFVAATRGDSKLKTVTVNTPAGAATGDVLVGLIATAGGPLSVPSGWTIVTGAALAQTSSNLHYVWLAYRHVIPGEPASHTFTHTAANSGIHVAIHAYRGADEGEPFLASECGGATSLTTPSRTPATANSWAVFAAALYNNTSVPDVTGPNSRRTNASIPDWYSGGSTGNSANSAFSSFDSNATVPLSSTNKVMAGTGAFPASFIAFLRPSGTTATLVTSTETGTGTDTPSVAVAHARTDTGTATDTLSLTVGLSPITESGTATDAVTLQEQRTVADSAAGTETLDVTAIEFRTSDDTGLGTDATLVDIPDLFYLDDAGIGSDTSGYESTSDDSFETGAGTDVAAILRVSSTTDAGTGSDAPAVQRQSDSTDSALGSETAAITKFTVVTDGGIGSDNVVDLFRVSSTSDSGVGTDTVPLVGPIFGDFGLGTDVVSIVDIPFTQILPLKSGPIYDLVVVARIPQASGPPSFIEVDPIEWKGLTYVNTLSQPQDLSAGCLLSSVTESILQRLRSLHSQATELWLYRNGKIVFAGPLVGWQTSGENLTLSCKGLLSYLRLMVVQADLRFVGTEQFTIAKTLIDQWQNLEHGNYGIDTTTVGASGVTREATYLRDEVNNVGKLITDLGVAANGFDAEVDPASRKLQLWSPRKGVDRSEGEDAIVIDARNVTSADILCSVAGGDLASEAYGTATSVGADATMFSLQSNLELRSRFGRCAVSQSFTDVPTQAQLDANVQGLLDARGEALLVPGPRTRVTPDADLTSFGVGDTISYELGSTLGVSGAFRIRKQSVTVSSTGQESVDLEFV